MSSLFPRRPRPEPSPPAPEAPSAPSPELVAEHDRLVERFAVMQSELGGLFYEMAIRDHVQMDVLIARAAELQRVDAELAELEAMLEERP